jgi:class 3 adenylate cyclase
MKGGAPLATFDGPARAVRCAFSMVSQGSGLGLSIRAAVHTGECEFNPAGLPSGYAIELTSRILPVTHPGKVVVSRVVKDLVAGSGIQFAKHQSLSLDGEDWPLFQVVSC